MGKGEKRFYGDIAGLFGLGGTFFVFFALISYHPQDWSFSRLASDKAVLNWCGALGSFVADGLFHFLGLGAFGLVALLGVASFRWLLGFQLEHFVSRAILGFGILISSTVLLQHYGFSLKLMSYSATGGGFLGFYTHLVLHESLNSLGLQLVCWVVLASLAVLTFEINLRDLVELFFKNVSKAAQFLLVHLPKFTVRILVLAFKWFEAKLEAYQELSPVAQSARASGSGFSFSSGVLKLGSLATSLNSPNNEPGSRSVIFPLNQEASAPPADEKKGVFRYQNDDKNEDKVDQASSSAGAVKRAASANLVKVSAKPVVRASRLSFEWKLPSPQLIQDPPKSRIKVDEKELQEKARILQDKLGLFGVTGEIVAIKPGPAVTLFEFRPESSVKISKITELEDDLAMALASESLRIMAPIPGRDVVGIETSNRKREVVYLKDMILQDKFWSEEIKLPITLGRKVDGEPETVDLRKMPHLMVAGTTGSGKSVFTVSALIGLIYKHSPETLKVILIDPKQVDLAAFENLPHLILPVVTDSRQAVMALKWAVQEMEKRYRSMSQFGARGLEAYNEIVQKLDKEECLYHAKINQELEQTSLNQTYYYEPLPYIVIVVEEFADLMTVDKGQVETSVIRLAQKARACGIHLILCLQSPRKEFVTGAIKSNIPGRIAFKAASSMESRIILDETGAERLLANGDMLYRGPGSPNMVRHHGPFLTDSDILNVIEFWSGQSEPIFNEVALKAINSSDKDDDKELGLSEASPEASDDRYHEILDWILAQSEVSASLIQRRFQLGYPRAARLIEVFESQGIIGPANGSKPRQVLKRSHPPL